MPQPEKSAGLTCLTVSKPELKTRALVFANRWKGNQQEEANAKTFVDEFFAIFGRDRLAVDARFEHRVERPERGQGRIDLFWPGKLVIEMKSTGKDLGHEKPGAAWQAFEYINSLDSEDRPRWVMVCDFAHLVVYDLGEDVHDYLKGLAHTRKSRPVIAGQFPLSELPNKLHLFAFIRDEEQALFQTQPEVNLKAVALLGELHDELKATGYSGHQLERFLVRILFCLFAEDTDIFDWNLLTRFVHRSKKDGSDLGPRLARLFQVLNKDTNERTTTLEQELSSFPYINGGLFSEKLDIADLNAKHRAALLACCQFDWAKISPGVFGSLFQGVMDKKERREKGAHYTSELNIRRVIDPLFLDALREEFTIIKDSSGRIKKLQAFHEKLAGLRFLDPACGCGNFLVVAYRELRALELEVLRAIYGNQLPLGLDVGDLARINVDQFYGIELEEFPALIAETALWLTDHQVNMAFSKAFGRHYARIPLRKSATIVPGNALRLDWNAILPPNLCSYVLGNPPFIGKQYMTEGQNSDMDAICGTIKGYGVLDYVAAWYVKAADYIQETRIGCAFVSTNSISQGEQPSVLWGHLFRKHIKIQFAYRTFVWANEASGKAHVHVVIVGFGALEGVSVKRIFETDNSGKVTMHTGLSNISPYLVPGGDNVVTNRKKPLSAPRTLAFGNMPNDGGNLLLSDSEKTALVSLCQPALAWLRPILGPEEFINGSIRWCLWLVNAKPSELRGSPEVMKRIEAVKAVRLASSRDATRNLARTPTLFGEIRQPTARYLAIPKTSSERRHYVPIDFLTPDVIASADLFTCEGAEMYDFGVLTSTMHMSWMRTVAGRLKSDYRYSAGLVYNTFPWPNPDTKQRAVIESAAQAVRDARAPLLDGGTSLADLYNPLLMPNTLLNAHQVLDRAVDKAYRTKGFESEHERVEFLFARYEELLAPLAPLKVRQSKSKAIRS